MSPRAHLLLRVAALTVIAATALMRGRVGHVPAANPPVEAPLAPPPAAVAAVG